MPWYSRQVSLIDGRDEACCWLKSPVSRRELQQQFMTNDRPAICERCWSNEDRGIESRRQMENRFLDFKMDRDLNLIEQDVQDGRSEINLYQIYVGSLCNGMCAPCGPGSSSAWKQLLDVSSSIQPEISAVDRAFDQLKIEINWQKIKRINILGGEPLLIKKSFDILEALLDAGNTDCRISFISNGSVKLNQKQIDLFQNFSDISCCLSIDGIGRTFEYCRYPLSWTKTLENLEQYRKIFTEIVVSFTITNLNYHERDDIIKWFQNNNLLFIENYVESPRWFNYKVTPGTPEWQKFVQEIARQDQLKGIKIKDYIPTVAEMIEGAK